MNATVKATAIKAGATGKLADNGLLEQRNLTLLGREGNWVNRLDEQFNSLLLGRGGSWVN